MIDWSKPIETDTSPPRHAYALDKTRLGGALVRCDWHSDGDISAVYVEDDGAPYGFPDLPKIRNVAQPEKVAAVMNPDRAERARLQAVLVDALAAQEVMLEALREARDGVIWMRGDKILGLINNAISTATGGDE
jgi:hypothetical protein